MKLLLFNREEDYIGNIKYVVSATHPEELNGEDLLEITTLDNRIEKGYRIIYRDIYGYWKEFIVKGIEEIHNLDGKINYVYCESSFYETIGDYVEDKRPQNTTASVALLSALESTRWTAGIVDDLGINSTNFYHISAKESVQKIVETWKGELRTRVIVSGNKIAHRYVDILQNRGQDFGKRFVYSKDITEIKRIIQRDDVITALYGYGKGEELDSGGYGRRIDFADINLGKAYVENNDARLIWGRLDNGVKTHIFSKVEFDDVTDPQELLSLTVNKLSELSQPLVTYEAKVIDLKAYGLDHEGAELGDTVNIIDKTFSPELRLKAKVIGIKRDLLNYENNDVILGNFRPTIINSALADRNFINNFRSKTGVWDRSGVINQDGSINANILNDLVDELNSKMNSTGGYVYISEDGKGIITYDKPIEQGPTSAIQILGGSIRIANSKLSNGEWNWRTFGTGDGFVADLITTGTLDAGLVKAGILSSYDGTTWINLEDGSFNFKDALKWENNQLVISGLESGGNKVFNSTPTPPYKVNDLWKVTGVAGVDFRICTTARASGSYVASDWTNVSDSKAYADTIKNLTTGTSISGGITTINRDKVRVEHSSGQYSEIRADGFIRKWQYGEAKYLNDIYTAKFYEYGNNLGSSLPNPYRINLPLSFRGRTNVNIYVIPLDITIYGGLTARDDTIRELMRYTDIVSSVYTVEGVESRNLDANPPWVDIEAYTYQRVYNRGDYENEYIGMDWLLLAIGY